jgi:hypothetical protein
MHHPIALTAVSLIAFALGAAPAHAQFKDVGPERDDAQAIAYVFSRGIVSGYPDGTFRPDATINRAEFAKISVLFYWKGEKQYADMCNSVHFDDVPRGMWFFHFVCSAKDQEIVEGYPGTRIYGPDRLISVAEASKMITKAFKIIPEPVEGPWYAQYVRVLANRRALPVSLPELDRPITRGQVAEIFFRLETNTDVLDTLTYEQMMGEETDTNPCTAPPAARPIGDTVNPIAPEYERLEWLGPIFTASDCGKSRLKALYGDLSGTTTIRLVLRKAPSWELYNALYAIGFAPTSGTATAESKEWSTTRPTTYRELLELLPYADEMSGDDCISCG